MRGSLVLGKLMEPRVMTTCSVYFWTGVNQFPYLRREWRTISNISFVHKVHEDLLQVFIDPIGLTLDKIPNFIISRHCCWVGFCSKCWAKWAAKVCEFFSCFIFCAISWKCCSILFLGCFECFPHIMKDIILHVTL